MAHIDTLKAFRELVASGMPEKQAEAQVSVLDSSLRDATEDLATKKDLEILEKDLKVFFGYTVGGSFLALFLAPLLIAVGLKLLKII